jgi:uncharacterized protein (DUF2147 family)
LARLWLIAAWLCGSVVLAHAAATQPANPTGRWYTADHSAVVQIAPCGKDLCGQIVGLADVNQTGEMPTDWQGQPQCGLTILQTQPQTAPDGSVIWAGTVLDPRNGNVYQATLALDASRHLQLHGYIGLPIFGQTQTWQPYPGRTLAGCKLAANVQGQGKG